MNDNEVNKKLEPFKKMLKREFYTVKQLVSMGIYGCKSTAHNDVNTGKVESAYTTERRLVIFTESLLKRIEKSIRAKQKEDKDETV